MKLKKVLACALAGAMVLLAGCSKGKNVDVDQLEKIKSEGKMVVALEGTWAPWSYHDEKNELVGFDVEVSKTIAEKLGVSVEFVEGEWDSLLAGEDAGRYDMVVNGVDYTEERAQKYDFTEPYAYSYVALIVKSDNEDIKSFEDLKDKSTVNSVASTYMDIAESYGAKATPVDTLDQTIEVVLAGRADATLNAEVSYYDYLSVHPDAAIKIAALSKDPTSVVIPLRKGDETKALREAVNQAIKELREEGKLAEISIKYFGIDITSLH